MQEAGWVELLHDHHKDTFSYLRDRERQRDRLFLIVIALFALLASSVVYSEKLLLATLAVGGAQLDVGALPPRALLSALWVFTLAISLRYCQVSINVERQYGYLHMLEEKISHALGDRDLYCREGRAYLAEYPAFSNWAWFSYVAIFPVLAVATTATLVVFVWMHFSRNWTYNLLDSMLALAIIISFFLYRVLSLMGWRRKSC